MRVTIGCIRPGRACLARLRLPRLLLLGLGLAAFAPALLAQAPLVQGTAYDRLDLATADAALRTFLSAFRRGDYVTAYWVLSPQAQLDWQTAIETFSFNRTLRGDVMARNLLPQIVPPIAQWEQHDMSFLFAHVMNVARREGMLPLDLSGLPEDLAPARLPNLGTGPAALAADGSIAIAVALAAYPGPVVFRMVTSPLGKWRLAQILPPGGDAASRPFGLPAK